MHASMWRANREPARTRPEAAAGTHQYSTPGTPANSDSLLLLVTGGLAVTGDLFYD